MITEKERINQWLDALSNTSFKLIIFLWNNKVSSSSFAELMGKLKVSHSTTYRCLREVLDKGFITCNYDKHSITDVRFIPGSINNIDKDNKDPLTIDKDNSLSLCFTDGFFYELKAYGIEINPTIEHLLKVVGQEAIYLWITVLNSKSVAKKDVYFLKCLVDLYKKKTAEDKLNREPSYFTVNGKRSFTLTYLLNSYNGNFQDAALYHGYSNEEIKEFLIGKGEVWITEP